MPKPNEIEIAGAALRRHRHVCAFFRDTEEEIRILLPFLREGLARGEKVICIVDGKRRDEYLHRLEQGGVEVTAAQLSGQLEVWSWDESYRRNGRFDQEAMLELIPRTLERARAQGYPLTRLVANMEWALQSLRGVHDLVEYEARMQAVLRRHDDPVICVYDSSRFGGRVVLDVLRTHPVAIVGGLLQENPFYLPPDEFLKELRAGRG